MSMEKIQRVKIEGYFTESQVKIMIEALRKAVLITNEEKIIKIQDTNYLIGKGK